MNTKLLQAAIALAVSLAVVGCIVAVVWRFDNWTFWAVAVGISAALFTLAAWKWRK